MARLKQNGLDAEAFIIDNFKYEGHQLKKSTDYNDIHNDIDATHQTLGAVSIKSQSSRFFNFAVEVRQENSDDDMDFIDGWFKTGIAPYYILAIRDKGRIIEAHLISKSKLVKLINRTKPRDVRSWNAMKDNIDRRYDLPVVKLISLKYMKRQGVILETFKYE